MNYTVWTNLHYITNNGNPIQGYRIFSTWMGDPAKVILLEAMIKTIRDEDLLRKTAKNGKILLNGLLELEVMYSRVHSLYGC